MAVKNYILTEPLSGKTHVLSGFSALPYMPYNKRKVYDYLYQLNYDFLDYEFANQYYKDHGYDINGACSVARVGNYVGRNFDWYYCNQVEFIVHRARSMGNYASVGVAGGLSQVTKSFVEDPANDLSEYYKLLPFQLQDGINEYGLFAEYNVVTTDYGENVVEPTGTQEVELSGIMLVRFILDKFSNATDAVNYIREHCKIYFPKSLHDVHYELHCFVCDATKSYIVEFVNNETKIIDVTNSYPYMTNFYRYGVTLNANGTVYTPATQTAQHNAMDTNGITQYGCGLERYNYLVANAPSVNSVAQMEALMRGIFYTKAYTVRSGDIWYTEFVGNGLTVKTPTNGYADILVAATEAYNRRNRDVIETWQTTHSSVYDLASKTLNITVQEDLACIGAYTNSNQNVNIKTYAISRESEVN